MRISCNRPNQFNCCRQQRQNITKYIICFYHSCDSKRFGDRLNNVTEKRLTQWKDQRCAAISKRVVSYDIFQKTLFSYSFPTIRPRSRKSEQRRYALLAQWTGNAQRRANFHKTLFQFKHY